MFSIQIDSLDQPPSFMVRSIFHFHLYLNCVLFKCISSSAFPVITYLVVLSGNDADLNGSCWRCKHKVPGWNNRTKPNVTSAWHDIKWNKQRSWISLTSPLHGWGSSGAVAQCSSRTPSHWSLHTLSPFFHPFSVGKKWHLVTFICLFYYITKTEQLLTFLFGRRII